MKKSIYDVYVTVTSQEQADRLKGICLEYGLPILDDYNSFKFEKKLYYKLLFSIKGFCIAYFSGNKTEVTESEFEQLAKEFKQ